MAELSKQQLLEALDMLRVYGTITAAAEAMGLPRRTLSHRISRARITGVEDTEAPAQDAVELPQFPDNDIPVEEILDTMERRFEKRATAKAARDWYEVKVKANDAIGLCFVGDPHIDSNGCNISLLRRDLEIMSQPGMYGVNIGDSTDGDWPGRLMRLHSESDTSLDTARRLAEWLLNRSGATWLAWIMGNHDLWGADADLMRARNINRIPMSDWVARWQIVFGNGRRCKIISSHSFKGHSMWNLLHSNQRAATMTAEANIYASGHLHNWAIHQEENAHREFIYWLVRSRGYKYIDEFAERLGHASQQHGATICAVIDPQTDSATRFVQCFADLAEAADYLSWKRSR